MKLKARPCCSACLTQLTEMRQCSGKIEVRYGIISVGLDGPSQPCDRFGICAVPQLGHTDIQHPVVDEHIARREAERIRDMGFRLYASADHIFGHTDGPVRAG